jgi:hypothetical protein
MMTKSAAARAATLGTLLAFSLTGVAQAQRNGYARQVSLPEGTVLRAELNESLSSVSSRPGQRFTATVQPAEDGSGLPSGTEVVGQVRSVRRASDRQPGIIDVDFVSLRTPDGRTYPITASLTSLDSSNIRRTADGRLESRGNSSKDRTKFIGYGAGAGALIGALTGDNLLLGAVLGAAAGYLYGELNKDKERRGSYADVSLKEGTEFGVELDRRLALAVPAIGNGRYEDRSTRYDSRSDTRTGQYDSRYGNRTGRYDDRAAGYRDSDIRVYVNDRELRLGDNRPFLSSGRVLVPLNAVLDATGHRYNYDSRDREITVNGNRGDARLVVGESYASIDGERVRLDVPTQRIDGVLYVPTQFLEEATDIRSDWDAERRTLRLTSRSRTSLPYESDYRTRY